MSEPYPDARTADEHLANADFHMAEAERYGKRADWALRVAVVSILTWVGLQLIELIW